MRRAKRVADGDLSLSLISSLIDFYSTMKPFRLLDLPYLAFEEVSKYSGINLISLSFCSRESYSAVKRLKWRPQSVSITPVDKHHQVAVRGNSTYYYWFFYQYKDSEESDYPSVLKIGEHLFPTRKYNRWHFRCLCADPIQATASFLEYLKELTDCKYIKYGVSPEKNLNWKRFLTETVNTDPNCYEFQICDHRMKNDDVEFVLENCKTDVIRFGNRFYGEYQLRTPITNKYLIFDNPGNLGLAQLLNSNCERIDFGYSSNFTPSLMNSYLKEWIKGEHSKMIHMTIFIDYSDLWDLTKRLELFDGIKTEGFVETRNLDDYLTPFHQEYRIWDFDSDMERYEIRRNDGIKATISFYENAFLFLVWHLK